MADDHIARNVGQAQVTQEHVEVFVTGQVHRLAPAAHRGHPRALGLEQQREDLADVLRVLHQEDPRPAQRLLPLHGRGLGEQD